MRSKGVVKSWSDTKGCGYITPDDSDNDVFVHFHGRSKKYVVPGRGQRRKTY